MIHLLGIVAFSFLPAAQAQSISPLRVLLSPGEANAVVTVGNPSNQNKTIHIGWEDLTLLENGTYRISTTAERQQSSAAPHLLVRPARFHLGPGEQRQIKIDVRDDFNWPEQTEKRSHLVIHFEDANGHSRRVSSGLQLDMARAISLPVIMRSSEAQDADNSVRIWEAKLRRVHDGGLALDVILKRSGPHSIYGKLVIESPLLAGGDVQTLSEQDNIALYTENETRVVSFPLGLRELPESTMTVTFSGSAEYAGRTFAKREFAIKAPQKSSTDSLRD
ncbi:MAG: hypothetical protein MRY72_08725 [Aquisalinus sp.]|nr:hypothetical protein [Aquisalinus sp.]